MNLIWVRRVAIAFFVLGLVGMATLLTLKTFGVYNEDLLHLFNVLLGVVITSVSFYGFVERSYVVGLYHLYGWHNNRCGVWLRQYANGELRPHRQEIVGLSTRYEFENALPRSPKWGEVKGRSDLVIVCGSVFTYDGRAEVGG